MVLPKTIFYWHMLILYLLFYWHMLIFGMCAMMTRQHNRKPTTFRDKVTADGSSGYKAEAGRYHMNEREGASSAASHACARVCVASDGAHPQRLCVCGY
jgi:hypothetical protein